MTEIKVPKWSHTDFETHRRWVYDMWLTRECWFSFYFYKTENGHFYSRTGEKPFNETDIHVATWKPSDQIYGGYRMTIHDKEAIGNDH